MSPHEGEWRGIPVMHIISGLPVGGAQTMLIKLLRATDHQRWAPVVVSLRDRGDLGDQIESLGIPLCTLGVQGPLPHPAAVWRLSRHVRRYPPRVIQGWMPHGNLAAVAARRLLRRRVPVVWNVRNLHVREQKRLTKVVTRLGGAVSGRADRIVYNSRRVAEQFEHLGYGSDRSVVIPNGFDVDQYAPSRDAKIALRRRLRLSESIVLIALIARFHPIKDHRNFLQAAALLGARFPEVRFVLGGAGIDSGNPSILRWLEETELRPRVHLIGEIGDMPAVMAGLDLLCSASVAEGFPSVVGEAMACEVPCVVTDVGDSAWVVSDTGAVVPPRDPHALAAALADLIEVGADQRQQLGRLARQRIVENFSLPAISARYASLYEDLLARYPAGDGAGGRG